MRQRARLIGLATALAMVVTACAGGGSTATTANTSDVTTPDTLPEVTGPDAEVLETRLVAFDACEPFLDYVIGHAVDLVGPYGLDDGFGFWPGGGFRGGVDATLAAEAAAADDGAATPAFSETNVQVEGVDEPDMVKTDGNRIVVMSQGQLVVVDVTGDEPVETGRLTLRDLSAQRLFLNGDKVLLFGSVWNHGPIPLLEDGVVGPRTVTPVVQIIEVDITDTPDVVRTMTIDGALISGRMIDDAVRLVLTSFPVGFDWQYPSGSGLRAEREAIEANREIVRNSTEDNWIPYYVVADGDGRVTAEGTLFDCERAAHPREFSGLNMLSVLTIDLGSGLEVLDSTGVLATGDTVYASHESLYVATQNWDSWRWFASGEDRDRPDGPTTDIHKFDISDATVAEYVASGMVDGYLLNQFAMDEHDGMLRVASTTTPAWWWGSGPDSESRVTVLREIGQGLVPVGMVDGLGKTERIYSVRFMGDVAYVVTFREVDPLYTLDLSDPRRPQMVGELKIPGYSAYLHPVGDGLVMGVGQDATDDGMVQGTQVSIFDVSDLSDPTRLDTYTLGEGTYSEVEWNHHAFLYWDDLAMIPLQQWFWGERDEGEFFVGAVGLRVSESGQLSEVNKVVHPGGEGKDWDWDYRSQISRSIVIGDSVYTISEKGIMKSSLDALDTEAWLDL